MNVRFWKATEATFLYGIKHKTQTAFSIRKRQCEGFSYLPLRLVYQATINAGIYAIHGKTQNHVISAITTWLYLKSIQMKLIGFVFHDYF